MTNRTLQPGDRFGQYKILRLLGRGGMGEVYAVEHTVLGKNYALKLLNPDLMDSPEARRRLETEARVMADLEHPSIVGVDEYGETDGRHWLRMELVLYHGDHGDTEGDAAASLGDYLASKGGRLPEAEVRELLRQILEGLAYAHGKGMVHRDLKPANILLKDTGYAIRGTSDSSRISDPEPRIAPKALIADFGLVRLVGEEWMRSRVERSVARSMSLGAEKTLADSSEGTATHALLGTYAYMSPEQKRGEDTDERSDLYAVGLMAYQMLTGEESPGFDLPSDLIEGLDPAWDDWVRKATRPKAEDRFSSGEEMITRLPRQKKPEQRPEVVSSAEVLEAHSDRLADFDSHTDGCHEVSSLSSGPEEGEETVKAASEKPVHAEGDDRRSHSGKRLGFLSLFLLLAIGGFAGWQGYEQGWFGTGSDHETLIDREDPYLEEDGSGGNDQRTVSSGGPQPGSDWTVDLPSGESMELVWLDPDRFTMGSPSGKNGRDGDEDPRTEVVLTDGFWLGKYEVTLGDYREYLRATGDGDGLDWDDEDCPLDRSDCGLSGNQFGKGWNQPVVEVSWEAAMRFCRWLTERERREDRLPPGYEYTLPSEAQWEYACRAGTTTRFSFGDSADALALHGNFADRNTNFDWSDKSANDGYEYTAPVGNFEQNGQGLYDMHGNVWEWTRSWYGDYPGGTVRDYEGPSSGSYRVERGGGWRDSARGCRSANRFMYVPGGSNDMQGFRVALAPAPSR